MVAKYEFDFGTMFIFEHFAMGIMNEGVALRKEENQKLLEVSRKHFSDRPYGYISYRIHSYSVDPHVYIDTAQETNLVAIAVVSENPLNKLSLEVEKLFWEREFEHFIDVEDAQLWIEEKVKLLSKSA